MKHALSWTLLGVALCVLSVVPASAGPLAKVQTGPAAIEWQPALHEAGLTLTVSGPEGFYLRQEFPPGKSPSFSVFDGAGDLRPAGIYVWELRAVHTLDEGIRQELDGVRSSGDRSALQMAGKLPAGPTYQSGSFSILEGAIVAGGLEEPDRPGAGSGNVLAPKVVLTNANGVIRNALCVGFDCPDAPAFGDSSILMMENNNRIKFGDTSAAPFPNNDWEIEANSATSGGLSYLGFNDCGTADDDGGCVTDLVFAVEAGARQNALYVESDGDVGIGTSNPAVDLHIVTGNSPALRLEQDGSSGFTPQIWDIAGNETNFFVRDVTGASGLPFRIFPGAGSSALVIDGAGEVGVGTASPSEALHVRGTDGDTELLVEEANAAAATRTMLRLLNNGGVRVEFDNTSGDDWVLTGAANFNIDFSGSAGLEAQIQGDGDLLIGGSLLANGGADVFPDYVFAEDYPLMPLEELGRFVANERHLPRVPSSEDVAAAGAINMTQLQLLLLEKVEELTLYTLDQQELIADLQGEKAELEARLARLEAALGSK